MRNLIEKSIPEKKTSLFFGLLIFGFACLFLWFDKIGSSEWITVSMYLMTAYVFKRYKSRELEIRNGKSCQQEDVVVTDQQEEVAGK